MNDLTANVNGDDITVTTTITIRSKPDQDRAHFDAAGNLIGRNSPERVDAWLRAHRATRRC